MEFPIQLIRITQAPLKGSKSKFQLDFAGGVGVFLFFKSQRWTIRLLMGGGGGAAKASQNKGQTEFRRGKISSRHEKTASKSSEQEKKCSLASKILAHKNF